MAKRTDENVHEIDEILGSGLVSSEISKLEADQISFAADYTSLSSSIRFDSFDSLAEDIYDLVEYYIPLDQAIQIVAELDRYVVDEGLRQQFLSRYGEKSIKYEDIVKIQRAVELSTPRPTNVWELKKMSPDSFDTVLRLACAFNPALLKNRTIAQMALLRFYIMHLVNALDDEIKSNGCNSMSALQYAFAISKCLGEIELCSALNSQEIIEKLHTYGASINKKLRDDRRFSDIANISSDVWRHGCELLHTQLLLLLNIIGLVKEVDIESVNRKIKKIAPANRIYGPGQKKIISTCPCSKEKDCPLAKKNSFQKRYNLPASGKAPTKKL